MKLKLLIILFLSISTTSFAGLNDGLLAWYRFDDGSGTNAKDSSGQGHSGTLVNSPSWIIGPRLKALQFDGSTNYVSTNYTFSSLLASTTKSISAWVKPGVGSSGCVIQIIKEYGSNGFGISTSSSKFVVIYRRSGDNYGALSSNSLWTSNNWYFVTIVQNGTFIGIYINGILDNSSNDGVSSTSSSVNALIGAFNLNPPIQSYFLGSIDDVRIYNRSLSSSEISDLYKAGITINNAKINNAVINK
jgi:hypothetical protein